MIEIKNLAKHFGPLVAVDDISFSVAKGEVLGFLGPNGAGKSTTMKMITGFLDPSAGTAEVCGFDVRTSPIEVKARVGYLPEGAPLYADMTPRSFLRFVAAARGIPAGERSAAIEKAVHQVHIEGVLGQRIETLSKGYKRRVGLAQAILHDPEVLILDEPTDGLDPNQKHDVRTLIRQMSKDKCIVLSTHILEEVKAVCSRAIIIASGKLLFDGTPTELQERSPDHQAVSLSLKVESSGGIAAELEGIEGAAEVLSLEARDGVHDFMIRTAQGASILGSLSRLAHERGWEVDHLAVEEGRLDQVFRDITMGATQARS